MNLSSAFHTAAQSHFPKDALFWGEEHYSYAELWDMSVAASRLLAGEFQVKAGDRVGLWLKNCPEFIPAFFGILHTGAVVVPINNFLKPQEVSFILSDAGIDLLITDAELAAHLPALLASSPGLKIFETSRIHRATAGPHLFHAEPAPRGAQDLAVLIYTSGTTGKPKGAMLSHSNLLHNVESCRIVLAAIEQDRFAVLLPLFHSYMMTVGMLLPLLTGASMLLIRSLHPAKTVLEEILRNRATVLAAIPAFYRGFVGVLADVKLPLRLCISGAAPLPAKILQEFEDKFKIPLIEGYGLSEASPVVTKNPLDGRRKPGSIGIPIANVEVSIQDDTGKQLGTGEIGELCVRGGNVMLGYWNNPEETAKAFRNGWLLTGDLGYRDEDGFYYITDRKKDMLLVNGCNVYPREVEEVIYRFPGVKEAAVVGLPDPRRGEQPVAFVAPNDGTTINESELQQFLRSQLADYKVPRKVIVMAALPRNATGKILKTTLRQVPVGKELA